LLGLTVVTLTTRKILKSTEYKKNKFTDEHTAEQELTSKQTSEALLMQYKDQQSDYTVSSLNICLTDRFHGTLEAWPEVDI